MSDWKWLKEIEDNQKWVTTDYDGMKDAVVFSKQEVPKLFACIKEMEKTIELTKGSLPFGDPLYRILSDALARCKEGKF